MKKICGIAALVLMSLAIVFTSCSSPSSGSSSTPSNLGGDPYLPSGDDIDPNELPERIEIVTEPTKKVYITGESIDLTGIVVKAFYKGGRTRDITKYIGATGFDSTNPVESQTIRVSYGETTYATFTVQIKFGYKFHDTVTAMAAGTDGSAGTSATYVEFGDWPQDVISNENAAKLGLEASTSKVTRGYLTFVLGNDGYYYVSCDENASSSTTKYKDGTTAAQNSTSKRWFKVMPVKWLVIDKSYDVDGTKGSSTAKLLVSENILTGNIPFFEYDNSSVNRKIGSTTVNANDYENSEIRAYLNGKSYVKMVFEGQSITESKWNSKGFLQTAFGSSAQKNIIKTYVDNNINQADKSYGTGPVSNDTEDSIFLLSYKEMTSSSYGFLSGDGADTPRTRSVTDFAVANHVTKNATSGYGSWWLRSPKLTQTEFSSCTSMSGTLTVNSTKNKESGVVPVLAINFD